jgi:hypothetical protein
MFSRPISLSRIAKLAQHKQMRIAECPETPNRRNCKSKPGTSNARIITYESGRLQARASTFRKIKRGGTESRSRTVGDGSLADQAERALLNAASEPLAGIGTYHERRADISFAACPERAKNER